MGLNWTITDIFMQNALHCPDITNEMVLQNVLHLSQLWTVHAKW